MQPPSRRLHMLCFHRFLENSLRGRLQQCQPGTVLSTLLRDISVWPVTRIGWPAGSFLHAMYAWSLTTNWTVRQAVHHINNLGLKLQRTVCQHLNSAVTTDNWRSTVPTDLFKGDPSRDANRCQIIWDSHMSSSSRPATHNTCERSPRTLCVATV